MADVVNIPSLVWKILNITPQLLGQYRTIQDQLLYLIFIPNLVLIFFIYLFATNVTYGHRGFRNLFGIAAYATIILSGWYGKFLIPLFVTWWWLWLGLSMFVFLFSVIFKPGKAQEAGAIGSSIAGALLKKGLDKRDAAKLVKDIDGALRAMGLDPNIPLQNQKNFQNIGKEAQDHAAKLVTEREKLKRLAREWV